MSTTPLFRAGPYAAHVIEAADVPALQAFFERNPEYFETVGGEPPTPTVAQEEFDDLPPAGMTFRGRWVIGLYDRGALVAMAHVLGDFLADGVAHIGLYIVASALHGSGTSTLLYQALEDWLRGQRMRWIRLGAVVGNAKAERFWRARGYIEVRRRSGIVMGRRTNELIVFVKPLAATPSTAATEIAHYLERVERDRPESTSR